MATTTGLIPNWYPPTRENYDLIMSIWKWFPVAASLQWVITWYGMGKTSVTSRFNLPGRIGWLTMEAPGFLTLLYHITVLPSQANPTSQSLPWQNKLLATLFVTHYTYRAILFPLIQPSMSPLHALVWLFGVCFQLVNGTCVGAYLAAYGPTTQADWERQLSPFLGTTQLAIGTTIFFAGLAANYLHDEELRNIRRRENQRQARIAKESGGKVDVKRLEKHYEIPKAGLFKVMLYPHYFVEWIEWLGFWVAGGWGFLPARCFLLNEVAAMLPRAVNGKKWYEEKFGKDKIEGKWAVIPGVV